jgi:putative ABC transport system permease protein
MWPKTPNVWHQARSRGEPMHAIDRKLIRDFRRLWAQALAIALVLACGVAILLTSLGMYRALDETRTAYY